MANYGNQVGGDEEAPAMPSAGDWQAAMSGRDREAPAEEALSPGRNYGRPYVEPGASQ